MFYKISNEASLRHKDENGFLMVDKSPILRAGILEYFGSELLPEGQDKVDGVAVDPAKIYKVMIPEEEIEKAKDTFKLLPILDDHTWMGDEGEDPKDHQVGSTGEDVSVENGMLMLPLKFTGKKIVEEVESHDKEELSASYYNRFEKSSSKDYDFIARDLKGNHLALVDKGRCGSAVRVLNSTTIGVDEMAGKAKVVNEAILKLDGKEIDLDRFFEEEKNDEDDVHADSITENEDKREIIREIMAVAGKSDEDFKGGEDEKVREVAKLAEKLAYNPSERSESDNACKVENEDKRKLIDEIGGILKGKVDEELWRTIIGKAEKLAYEGSEDSKADNEDSVEDEKEASKSMNYDAVFARISNAIAVEAEKKEAAKVKAYNSARAILGDFNPFGMSDHDMYAKALNHLGVSLDGRESVAEMSAMLKACSAVHSKVDNSFSYDVVAKDEIEFNL